MRNVKRAYEFVKIRLFKVLMSLSVLGPFPAVVFAAEEVSKGDLKTALLTSLMTGLGTVLAGIFAWIGTKVGKFVSKKIEDIDNTTLQKYAYIAVRAVEDKSKDLTGSDKFHEACKKVAGKVKGVSQDQVEDAVRAMFQNFNNEMPKNG